MPFASPVKPLNIRLSREWRNNVRWLLPRPLLRWPRDETFLLETSVDKNPEAECSLNVKVVEKRVLIMFDWRLRLSEGSFISSFNVTAIPCDDFAMGRVTNIL